MSRTYFDVEQHAVPTQQGPVNLPILYYNSACIFASFLVDSARAKELLPDALQAVSVLPGKALATVAFFHYADSSVGPYNEMGLAIACRPDADKGYHDTAAWHPLQSKLPGMHIVDLPVTTAVANAAGRECWGYPKIVVPIAFHLRGQEMDCTVHDQKDNLLCELKGRAGAGVTLPATNLMTYSLLGDTLLRTVINMRGKMRNARAGSVRLNCGSSDHPLSQHLRHLQLQETTPVLLQSAIGLQAILPAGEEVH